MLSAELFLKLCELFLVDPVHSELSEAQPQMYWWIPLMPVQLTIFFAQSEFDLLSLDNLFLTVAV